jgi:hypothetical protein
MILEVLKLALRITAANRAYYYNANPRLNQSFGFEVGIDDQGNILRDPPLISTAAIHHAAERREPLVQLDTGDVSGDVESSLLAPQCQRIHFSNRLFRSIMFLWPPKGNRRSPASGGVAVAV